MNMTDLEDLIKGYEDFEIAFLVYYRMDGFTENSRRIIENELIRRHLKKTDIDRLVAEKLAIKIKDHHQMICPRCKSERILSTREMIRNKHEASEGLAGREPRYEDKRYCSICYWDFSRDKTVYDKIKMIKIFILIVAASLVLGFLISLVRHSL